MRRQDIPAEGLPTFEFTRSARLPAEEEKAIKENLARLWADAPGGELKAKPETERKLEDLIINDWEWCREKLGTVADSAFLDRTTFPNKIKVYNTKDWEKFYGTTHYGGHLGLLNEIRLSAQSSDAKNYHGINHELNHSLANKIIALRKNIQPGQRLFEEKELLNGYTNPRTNSFRHWNEFVTETANISQLNRHRLIDPSRDYLTGLPIGRYTSTILFDMFMENTASKLSVSIEKLYDHVFEGYYTGAMDNLMVITEAYDKDILKYLSNLRESLYPIKNVEDMALHLHIDQQKFKDKVTSYGSNQPITILGNIEVKV